MVNTAAGRGRERREVYGHCGWTGAPEASLAIKVACVVSILGGDEEASVKVVILEGRKLSSEVGTEVVIWY